MIFPIEQTPLILPSCFAWYDAFTTPAGSVASWTDKSGNGFHLTQGTGSAQPTCTANTLAGKNVLLFDGGDKLIGPAGMYGISAGASTAFMVSNSTTAVGRPILGTAAGLSSYAFRYVSSSLDFVNNGVGLTQAILLPGFTALDWNIFRGSRSGTAQAIQRNNGTASTNSLGANVTLDEFQVGAGPGAANFHTGGIAEIIIYNRLLTAGEMVQINRYLSNKWGIAIS